MVATVLFLAVILLFDQNSMIHRISQKRQMRALQEEIDMYHAQIEDGTRLLDNIENDSLLLEKMARQNYNMNRSDEDVFIMD